MPVMTSEEVEAWMQEQLRPFMTQHKKTLDMLELLTNAGMLQQECKHDAEPHFCDSCAYAREKEATEARTKARAWLRECGRAVA